jgi:ADP-heptose:LPS heptosyltransferase
MRAKILTEPQKLILSCHLSPGDIVMLTAALRDLHAAYPGKFVTDVRTTADQLWQNNPFITRLSEKDADVRVLEMHYPLIHHSNLRPYHFIHGYVQYLEEQLQLRIPVTAFKGDIHVSSLEKTWMSQVQERGYSGPFWMMVAGGKFDFTAKWWNPDNYQKVVDHFHGRLPFVQIGAIGHWHPPLQNVLSLIGQTDTRQFVRLMYHADGVICPVTFAMHLSAAVETKPGRPKNRACVVIAGGREPAQWEAYPHHQFINTNGALWCCDNGGCWKSRCQAVGDSDDKDNDLCVLPVELSPTLKIPQCMNMIRAEDVIRRIELYIEGGCLRYVTDAEWADFEKCAGISPLPLGEGSGGWGGQINWQVR